MPQNNPTQSNIVIYVCSRYRADTEEVFEKQLQATRDLSKNVVLSGYNVIVPHLYYPTFLDDNDEEQRTLGINNALNLLNVCDVIVVLNTDGISEGMQLEINKAKDLSIPIIEINDPELAGNALKLQTVLNFE